MIRYTDQERDLMNSTTIGYLVLKKLARLVGDEQEGPIVSIPTESFIGKGYDKKDIDRISSELSEMTEIIAKFRFVGDRLDLALKHGVLGLMRKLAENALSSPFQGDGELFCEAALALKRKMGFRSRVFYQLRNDFEDFDHGEDCSYLNQGFDQDAPWWMIIDGKYGVIEVSVIIQPNDAVNLRIEQMFKNGDNSASVVSTLPRLDFINPDLWNEWMPQIIRQGWEFLDKKGYLK